MITLLDKPISIVLHHSVTRMTSTIEQEKTDWEMIKNIGISKHGIPDYHFGVGVSGNIYIGGSLKYAVAHMGIDKWDKPQHSSGVNNQNSFAICSMGNFEEYEMGEKQISGIVKCIRNLKISYSKLFIMLHRELVATACPGYHFPYQEIFRILQGGTMETPIFPDVEIKRWSYPAIKKVYDVGIMKGDENGFRPQDQVTREELAQVIANLLKYLEK